MKRYFIAVAIAASWSNLAWAQAPELPRIDIHDLGSAGPAAVRGVPTFARTVDLDELDADAGAETDGLVFEPKEKGKPLVVLGVYPDGPADRAGIQPGDQIIELESTPVANLNEEEISKAFPSGGEGTLTHYLVRRSDSSGAPAFKVSLTRFELPTPDVYAAMIGSNVAYVQLHGFRDGDAARLKKALLHFIRQGMTSLLIDLRDNPGGRIGDVFPVASVFLKQNAVIARIEDGEDNDKAYRSNDGTFSHISLAVLIDENCGLACGIFAEAMRDNSRSYLFGSRTFTVSSGPDNAVWLTPEGRTITGKTIAPDKKVSVSREKRSAIRRKLFRQITGQKPENDSDPVLDAVFK